QQLEHALLRLVGQRQRGDRDGLTTRQRLTVRRFLGGVSKRQVGCAGLQNVDQVLGEVLADLHDREVRTQSRRFGAQRGAGRAKCGERLVGRTAVEEVRTRYQHVQAQAGRTISDTRDAERGLAGLVEGQLESVAVQQVDAVERCVLRGIRELRQDTVVLADQVGANRL